MLAFIDKVKEWCEAYDIEGNASYRVVKKLKLIKDRLKEWCNEFFWELKRRKEELFDELTTLDKMVGEVGLEGADKERRENVKIQLVKMLIMEEVEWKQKVKTK